MRHKLGADQSGGASDKPVRAAQYVRMSTEHQKYSTENQSETLQQYAAKRGIEIVRTYADEGKSGLRLDGRDALKQLIDDVQTGKADFAKLVELFDAHGVSFVSVTQQFNTTTSMGRLTLNVLLSFTQFEREVTSERIRDKIAASKRKGLWVGGMVSLGYETKNRKITVNNAEANRGRTIFRAYLKVGSIDRLMVELRKRRIFTKVRTLKSSRTIGGAPFTRGPLAHLLRNRFYVGEVVFKGEVLKGEQPAIVDRNLFNAVQAKLNEQLNNNKAKYANSNSLLIGRIFDDRGNRMTPTHSRKQNLKYRYYISSPLVQGQAERAGSVRRVPPTEIETIVARAVRQHVKPPADTDDKNLIKIHVARVEI